MYLYAGGTKFNQSNVIEKCFYSVESSIYIARRALLKESSTSAATEDMDAHGGDSACVRQLSMTMDHVWDSLKKNWIVKLALKYGDYRVEHLKHLFSYIRSMMETRKFGK
jgi:hypothetical protein